MALSQTGKERSILISVIFSVQIEEFYLEIESATPEMCIINMKEEDSRQQSWVAATE
jgi:hypothetical protein